MKVKEKKVERIPDRSADRCLRELCDSDDEIYKVNGQRN